MILGNKGCIATYKGISDALDKAIDYVLALDENIEPGKYEIDGKNVYVSIFEGEAKDGDIVYEAHKNYIDLQFILKGGEVMWYAPLEKCTPITEYNAEKDVYKLTGEGTPVTVNAGDFYIVHPFDAHSPGNGTAGMTFKKAVVKIIY